MINRIFPWLSIRSKLIIAFVGLSIIPLLLVGIHAIFSNVQMMEDIAIENLSHDVNTIRDKTANFLAGIESDLNILRNSTLFRSFIDNMEGSESGPDILLLEQMKSELLSFCKTKHIYYQIRVINKDGDELLKIEKNITGDSIPGFRIIPREELRHTRETYYFFLTDNLLRGQMTFAPAEVVDKNNNLIPIFSFAVPLFGDAERVGILIANVYAGEFFQVIESSPHIKPRGKVVLIRSDGHYLYHSEKKKDWNRLLASGKVDNLYYDYPPRITAQLLSGDEGLISEGIDEIISYGPLFSDSVSSSGKSMKSSLTSEFFVFESIHQDIIMGPVRKFALTFTGFLLLFLITAVGLGILATRQFTKPILALERGAEIIAQGNYRYRLQVETHDEIEKLAAQFNSMAASLEANEHEIQQHRTRLEEKVKQRTRELTEEKMKLHAIIDNVPSAFILLDKDFNIQTASAVFSDLTGFSLEEVRGKNCSSIFCHKGFCRECICRLALENYRAESHVDRIDGNIGHERFIEHIAIPMMEDGDITSILTIITDITKRKQLEQNIIQTEKLAAAGEMSAIIAHEFRNLLTSVKMILQLRYESTRLKNDEKASLSVALNSISHMENFVTELLNFARPNPMEFQIQSLNDVIDESLNMTKLQISKKNIKIRKSAEPSLQPLLIDAALFKEALINVLLNSVQSFDYSTNRNRTKEITISAKSSRLRKTLRDFAFAEGFKNKNDTSVGGKEIVLMKGTKCAHIEIVDNGCGIEYSNLRRIFDPFFTTKPNGTGLGLQMVKRTVNAHGGIISVDSKKGKGTKINIYLPGA